MKTHKTHHFYLIKVWKNYRHLALYSFFLLFSVFIIFSLASFSGTDRNKIILGILASFIRLCAAFAGALVVGFLAGLLVTRNQKVENVFLPVFDTLQSFPFLALLPVMMWWLGNGSLAAIMLIFVAMIWPILFSIVGGIKNIRENLSEAAVMFHAGSGWNHFRYFLLPAIAPAIITGSIIAWGEGWETVVGAELVGVSTGIGAFIMEAGRLHHIGVMMAGLSSLLVFVFILNKWIFIPFLKKVTKHHE